MNEIHPKDEHEHEQREWLVTNGTGGYASMMIDGRVSRKYHGWLIASLPPPLGRVNMCSYIQDSVWLPDGSELFFSDIELLEKTSFPKFQLLRVELQSGLPVWIYAHENYLLKKTLFFIHKKNTVIITYTLLRGPSSLEIIFRPFFQFKHYEASVATPLIDCDCKIHNQGCEISTSLYPPLNLISKSKWKLDERELNNVIYSIESERGYDSIGNLKSMGFFSEKLEVLDSIDFVMSTESIEPLQMLSVKEARDAENERREHLLIKAQSATPCLKSKEEFSNLVLAADQFIVLSQRPSDTTWMSATGTGDPLTVIAGYHWFTDWGRDTMISLEGLTLITGRYEEAKEILYLFAHHVQDGLIPNMFPDSKHHGLYHTADATLWFIHALKKYTDYTHDEALIEILFPKIKEILQAHLQGTKFGIHMDKKDGLLTQGEKGYALTWMDAKVGDLVVTPRRGKAVEINGLWYNALCLIANWIEKFESSQEAEKIRDIARQCYESFNQKFWNQQEGFLYDIVEGENGNDPACRPNQLLAFSLDYPVLEEKYWKPVITVVHDRLVTPYGLRTLSPGHPDYKIQYDGNLLLRDLAYHQGTIWTWLLGPYIDAWLQTFPSATDEAHKFTKSIMQHLNESGLGTINEIFDSESPHMHRGCIAQAWSVAEILRCIAKTYN